MTSRITAIATEILRQHTGGEPFTPLSGELAPQDTREAYAAQLEQHAMMAASGRGSVAGRKIALASKVQQELCGIDHPIAGGIYQHQVHSTPATLKMADYHGLGIEYEVALTLATATKPGQKYVREQVEEMIAGVHPAYEMIIDRGADYANIDPLTMIADNAWCAGIVLGDDIFAQLQRDNRSIDSIATTLNWNDDVERASTAATDPVGALTWVINLMSDIGVSIEPGQPVITGSVMKTRYPVAGDTVRFTLGDYAGVQLQIR